MVFQGGHSLRKTDNGRNYGIDLLRIVAIYMIIVLHVLYFGEVISPLSHFTPNYEAAVLVEIASYGSVNLFAIISGYVKYGKKTKYSNLMQLYLQMLFYTVLCTFAFLLLQPDMVSKQTIIYSLIPFKIGQYWYFTSFFCLFFFIPFINKFIDSSDRKNAAGLLIICFILFSLLTTVLYQDISGVCNGYSFLWLAVMYMVGACINKFDIHLKGNLCLVYYLICIIATFAGKLSIEWITYMMIKQAKYGSLFVSYISPFIVFSSIFLFLFFKDLKLNQPSIHVVSFFAPTAFGVYLIHMEPLIKEWLINGRFRNYAFMPLPQMIGCVLGTALGILFVCSVADRVRLEIFKLLKIKSLCEWIENKIKVTIDSRFLSHFE